MLTVKGYINGKKVCNDEQRTSGKAVTLKLEQMNRVSASGNDMVLLTCSCIDKDGLEVPNGADAVTVYAKAYGMKNASYKIEID